MWWRCMKFGANTPHDLPAVIDREAFVRDCWAGDVAAKAFERVPLVGSAARARISEADTHRRNFAKIGAHIEPRLADAASRGTGIRLTAEEVAELVQSRS